MLAENAQVGDGTWLTGLAAPTGQLEAYASATSVTAGDVLTLFVSAPRQQLSAKVYRMGYYGGLGARLLNVQSDIEAFPQAIPTADAYGTVDCDWTPTFTLTIDGTYPPGQYLVRLENEHGHFRFVPFLVRDDASTATYLYVSAVTTWQAYNTWGGYSLYREATPLGTEIVSDAKRAVRVSFNRPYDRTFANGAADFVGNEFPLLFLAERWGLDLAYCTSIDLHERGSSLVNAHVAVLSLGHDEYWSPSMRTAVTTGIARGVNVAFFGANFCYRKIRFEPSVNGANRLMINYRSTADPEMAINPSLVTVNWSSYPSDQPESTFSGSLYGGADGEGSLHVVDANGWLWRGTHVSEGAVLPNALGGEFNHYDPATSNPARVQLFGHSPVGGGVGDITYVAEPGRGGVFCSGTGHWVYDLSSAPGLDSTWVPSAKPGVTDVLSVATRNIVSLFGAGPAGLRQPSVSNVASFYG